MKLIKKLIFLMMLFYSGICLAQQQGNWDAVLDRYELICERCLELKKNQESGMIPEKESISSLRAQLTMLRNNLFEVQGQMSKAQKARFDMIRQRFEDRFTTMPNIREKATSRHTALSKEKKKRKADPGMPPDSTSRVVRTSFDSLPDIRTTAIVTKAVMASPTAGIITHTPGPECLTPKKKVKYMAGLQGAIYPLKSIGLMAGVLTGTKGKVCLGGYVKCLSDFKFKGITPSYFCDSSGTTPEGRKVWTEGETTSKRFSAAGGVLMRIGRHCGFNLGVGYGSTQHYIKDISGNWVNVTDISASGFAGEIGALFFLGKNLWVNIGLSTTAFRSLEPQLAFGISF